MIGFPKHLNTKADYFVVRDFFPEEQWLPHWERLLDTKDAWLMVRKLAPGEAGQTDATHKVIENDLPDGTVERYQYEFKEDPNCRLKQLGVLVVQVTGGNQLSVSVGDIGELTDRAKLYFAVRKKWHEPDSANLLIIEETAGLIRFRGNAVPTRFRDRGQITVTDATNGNLMVTLDASGVDVLPSGRALFAVVKELADTSRRIVEAGWVMIKS